MRRDRHLSNKNQLPLLLRGDVKVRQLNETTYSISKDAGYGAGLILAMIRKLCMMAIDIDLIAAH